MPLELDDRLRAALAELVRELVPTRYLGFYEYQVASYDTSAQAGDLTPLSDPAMPTISKLGIRTPGMELDLTAGTSVLVGFRNGDITKPFVGFFDWASGGSFPTRSHVNATQTVELGPDPVLAAARQGDPTESGGVGTQVMFASAAGGDIAQAALMTMTPYFVSFGILQGIPATFPILTPGIGPNPLYGYITLGSPYVKE